MNYLLRRLREPSTWAGVAIVAGAVLPVLGVAMGTTTAVVTALGGVAMLVKDPGTPPTP